MTTKTALSLRSAGVGATAPSRARGNELEAGAEGGSRRTQSRQSALGQGDARTPRHASFLSTGRWSDSCWDARLE